MAIEVIKEEYKNIELIGKLKIFYKKYLANNELLSIPFLSIVVSFLVANFMFYPRFFRDDPLLLVIYLLVIISINYQLHNGLITTDETKLLFWFLLKLIEVLFTSLTLYKTIIEAVNHNRFYTNPTGNIFYGIILIGLNAILIRCVYKSYKEFQLPSDVEATKLPSDAVPTEDVELIIN